MLKYSLGFPLLGAFAALMVGCMGSNSGEPPELQVLSSRPDRVTGTEVLVALTVPGNSEFEVQLDNQTVTSRFEPDRSVAGRYIALIDGLKPGTARLTARANAATREQALTVYPITGPVFAGPHVQPFLCQAGSFALPDGSKLLPKPDDPTCSAERVVQYFYKTTAGPYKALSSSSVPIPSDAAVLKTEAGATVPYAIRLDTLTINRGIAQVAVLHDPSKDSAVSPLSPPANWNRRLVYSYGAGCPGGWYTQGTAQGYPFGVAGGQQEVWLGRGYAVATNTLNNAGNNCNALLQAESAAMTKEYFIKRFGTPKYTMTWGTSGGAIASLQIADMLPGLFDAAMVDNTFPDVLSVAGSAMDANLLVRYFTSAQSSASTYTAAQRLAVSGYGGEATLFHNSNQFGRVDPVPGRTAPSFPGVSAYSPAGWDSNLPLTLKYDPRPATLNLTGARASIIDSVVNVYGRKANPLDASGKATVALSPFDNQGVQYGLAALNSGVISVAQFLDLNQFIGGFDFDSNPVSARTTASADALKRAYQAGLVLNGGVGLSSIPVFDLMNRHNETGAEHHLQWQHFAVRDRMIQATGNSDNHVMWRGGLTQTNATLYAGAISAMERWMDAVLADKTTDTYRAKVIRNRPADLVDGCFEAVPAGGTFPTNFIKEKQTLGINDTACNKIWPSYTHARLQAGGPLAWNVLKCQLKPVDLADYKVTLSSAELDRLKSIFPGGVCDWKKPGVEQATTVAWPSVGPSTVNQIFDITKQ